MDCGSTLVHGDAVMIHLRGALKGKLGTIVDLSTHANDGEGAGMAKIRLDERLRGGGDELAEEAGGATPPLDFVWCLALSSNM